MYVQACIRFHCVWQTHFVLVVSCGYNLILTHTHNVYYCSGQLDGSVCSIDYLFVVMATVTVWNAVHYIYPYGRICMHN